MRDPEPPKPKAVEVEEEVVVLSPEAIEVLQQYLEWKPGTPYKSWVGVSGALSLAGFKMLNGQPWNSQDIEAECAKRGIRLAHSALYQGGSVGRKI